MEDGFIHPSTKIGKNVRLGHCIVIEENCEIGDDSFIGHFVIMRAGTTIGRNCKIGHYTIFEGRGNIGNNVTLMPHCQICIDAIIEDDVFCGPYYFGMNTPDIPPRKNGVLIREAIYTPPIIRRNVRISGGVMVLPGIEIGVNAFIGAGSVVTNDVPPCTIVYGVPAKIKGKVSEGDCIDE